MRTTRLSIAALCVLVLSTHGEGRQGQAPSPSADWNAFVAELLSAPAKPELTQKYFWNELARTKAQLARVQAMDAARLSRDEALDRRFAEAILAGREIEQDHVRRWRLDPRLYMASTRALVIALNDTSKDLTPDARAQAVLEALRAIPGELRQGPTNLTLYAKPFRDQAERLATEATAALAASLPPLSESVPALKDTLVATAAETQEAIVDWIDFLTGALARRPVGYTAVGVVAYDALLKRRELADYDSADLYAYAKRAMDESVDAIEEAASEIDASLTWQEILAAPSDTVADTKPEPPASADPKDADVKAEPPSLPIHRDAIRAARTRLPALGVLPFPWRERLDVVTRAVGPLDTTYFPAGSGSIVRAADGTLVGLWQVSPDEAMTNFLGRDDDRSVATVTAYAAIAGHALTLYQSQNPSTLRRSTRSAMSAEGWELYAEQRARDTGAFPDDDPVLQLRQLQLTLWRIARVVVDVGLHTRRLTEAEASTLLTEKAGLVAAAAAREIAEVADAPAAHLGYMGLVELLRIRDEVQRQRGAQFSFADFHDQLLKIGPLPPALVRAALLPR